MGRRHSLEYIARVLGYEKYDINHVYRMARLEGVLATPARGVNCPPLTASEVKALLCFMAKSACIGCLTEVEVKFRARNGFVETSSGVVARTLMGVRTTVSISQDAVDACLAVSKLDSDLEARSDEFLSAH